MQADFLCKLLGLGEATHVRGDLMCTGHKRGRVGARKRAVAEGGAGEKLVRHDAKLRAIQFGGKVESTTKSYRGLVVAFFHWGKRKGLEAAGSSMDDCRAHHDQGERHWWRGGDDSNGGA